MISTEKCPACNEEIIMQAVCPKCKFNIEIFEKAKRISVYLYNKGLDEYNNGCVLDSIDTLEKSLNFYKNNIVARNLVGILYYQIGEVGEALKHWVVSSNIKKEDNPATMYLEEMKKEKNLLDKKNEAVKVYNEALEYAKQGNEDIAIIRLQKVINLSPEFLKAYLLLALAYYKDEESKEKGKYYFDRARLIDKKSNLIRYYTIVFGEEEVPEKAKVNVSKAKSQRRYETPSMNMIDEKNDIFLRIGKLKFNKVVLSIILSVLITLAFVYKLDGFSSITKRNETLASENKILKQKNAEVNEEITKLNEEVNEYRTQKKKKEYAETLNNAINEYNAKNFAESYNLIMGIEKEYLSSELISSYDSIYPLIVKETGRTFLVEGKELFENSKNEEALAKFEDALRCAPNETFTGEIMYYMARTYEKMKILDDAKRIYAEISEKYAGTHIAEQAEYRNKILGE